mgnify:CR=1 FL=1
MAGSTITSDILMRFKVDQASQAQVLATAIIDILAPEGVRLTVLRRELGAFNAEMAEKIKNKKNSVNSNQIAA